MYSYDQGGRGIPRCHCTAPVVGFSGVPGAAQLNTRLLKVITQFQGARRATSSLTTSTQVLAAIASFEPSLRDDMVERVPIRLSALLAISTSVVIQAPPIRYD